MSALDGQGSHVLLWCCTFIPYPYIGGQQLTQWVVHQHEAAPIGLSIKS